MNKLRDLSKAGVEPKSDQNQLGKTKNKSFHKWVRTLSEVFLKRGIAELPSVIVICYYSVKIDVDYHVTT